MGRTLKPLVLSSEEREELERLLRRSKTNQSLAFRARIVLTSAQGWSNQDVAEKLGTTNQTVGKWRNRFIHHRLPGLADGFRSGAPRSISDDQVEEVVRLTLETTPKNATHWSNRELARKVGLSRESIRRIWRAFGLQPHRTECFKLSKDPFFVAKVRDIVGLYLNPPDKALVLCVDEKSQIQALDRTQPLLPMRPGQAERRTHDYERHGTVSLFAALEVATGRVVGECYRRHRAREFIKFLNQVKREVPEDLDLHVVLDNASTHKTKEVQAWLKRNPRFTFHFTPTGCSWINLVERWFALITDKQIRRGTFRNEQSLVKAIKNFIECGNENPKPFIWTKDADEILASVARFCLRTLQELADS